MTERSIHWVHSAYVKSDYGDAVIVKEKILSKDENGNIKAVNRLVPYENPRRCYWMTNEKYRTHKYKREYAPIHELDVYEVANFDLCNDIWKKFGRFGPCHKKIRDLCNDPYIYGADIEIEVLVKMGYTFKSIPGYIPKYTIGMLDIEASVSGCDRINAITFIHEKKVYCTMLDDFMYKWENGNKVKASIADVQVVIDKYVQKYIDDYGFEIEFFLGYNEMDMIKWIWSKIHFHQTDFIGIWNMDYDIPKIMARIEANGYDPMDIMCDPDLEKRFRYINYYKDPGRQDKGEHFTDRWSWFTCTAHPQFIDSMCLYSRLRKVNGRKSSYALDAISTDEIGEGKLKTGPQSTHHHMQKYQFPEYVAYNIVDAMLLQMMEWKNGDITTMTRLVGNSKLSDFSKQTVMLKNKFFEYCKERNLVPAAAGSKMRTEFDDLMGKFGGTVLSPEKTKNTGLKILDEIDIETLFHIFVSDLDVSSMYPNVTSGLNIAKETNLATAVSIENRDNRCIEYLFGGIASPIENAAPIMKSFFNLPTYEEMSKLYIKSISDT